MHAARTSAGLLEPEFLQRLERLAVAAKKVQLGAAHGERRSKRKGVSVEFADYRDYVQGDDLRRIDWNLYGRLDALYLKLFEEQEDLTVHLLIDRSQSMSYGTPPKLAFAQQLAAAIGYVALMGFDQVSSEAFSGAGRATMAPCRGRASAARFFAFLEGLEPGGSTELSAATRSYALRNRRKGVAVLFSDFFDADGYEAALKQLVQMGSEVYAVHVLAPEEIDPRITGDLKLLDSETGAYTEISVSPALLKRYKKNLDGFCASIRQCCVARGIGYVRVVSDTPIEQVTLDLLRREGLFR